MSKIPSQDQRLHDVLVPQMIEQLMNLPDIVLQDRVQRRNAERIADFLASVACRRGNAGSRLNPRVACPRGAGRRLSLKVACRRGDAGRRQSPQGVKSESQSPARQALVRGVIAL